jgi:hypothetical protein
MILRERDTFYDTDMEKRCKAFVAIRSVRRLNYGETDSRSVRNFVLVELERAALSIAHRRPRPLRLSPDPHAALPGHQILLIS